MISICILVTRPPDPEGLAIFGKFGGQTAEGNGERTCL
jgi:hypothetical protein